MREPQAVHDPGTALLEIYEQALPEVYGYVLSRCNDVAVAEDVTAEAFLAAVDALGRGTLDRPSVGWLIGTARHKLADHWRRTAREERRVRAVAGGLDEADDPWEARLEVLRARQVLYRLGAHHQAALVLRYVDGLPVAEVAHHLGRTLHATEALLVRARAAFRAAYEASDDAEGPTS